MNKNFLKKFKLPKDQLKPLVGNLGSCLASDAITVDGEKIGWMYREEADNNIDSGWRFFSGSEDEQYTENPDNFSIYDVNTIANYDQSIIPHLEYPVGSAFEWDQKSEGWRKVIDSNFNSIK